MSGRPKIVRTIAVAPVVSGFRPYGMTRNAKKKESLFLLYEEYEALRLCDYEKHTQAEASAFMNVSRPTLTRIYMSAREKIAQAFVEGRNIIIEGGKVCFDSEWYTCYTCNCFFNNTSGEETVDKCPLCGSGDVHNYESISDEKKENSFNLNYGGCGRGHCSNKRKRGKVCKE
jgi:predicted DNA-binding protein (UPF0251 family)